MSQYEFAGTGSTHHVDQCDLDQQLKSDEELGCGADDVYGLTDHGDWKQMSWWYCEERPCLGGDDIFVGIDSEFVCVIFDCVAWWYPRPKSMLIPEVLRRCCLDEESLGARLS